MDWFIVWIDWLIDFVVFSNVFPGDFPQLPRMQEALRNEDFTKFHVLNPKLIRNVDRMLAEDIAGLMQMISMEESKQTQEPLVKGGAFDGLTKSPFGVGYGEGANAGQDAAEWIVGKDKYRYDEVFYVLNPIDGKITGAAAKQEMVKSKLPNSVLGKIWKLADVDKDGMLDIEEWALANHLMRIKLDGNELPVELPAHLYPPSKAGLYPKLRNGDEDEWPSAFRLINLLFATFILSSCQVRNNLFLMKINVFLKTSFWSKNPTALLT